jgi:hypothetical protein
VRLPRRVTGRRVPAGAVALGAYTLVSFLYFGLRVVLRSGGTSFVGYGADPQIFIWSFAWWPHAILHGENPFVTHAIWAPDGVNLTWATTVPGVALLFSPLTLLFGAVASYNIAAVLIPALAAWTAFLLCRHITHSTWASLAGGYLFGFSSYMIGQEEGHMHMTSVFLLPLIALVILRFVEGDLGGTGLVVRLGPLLALQLGFSTELTFTLALAIACGIALAFVVAPALRGRLRSLLGPFVAAGALAAALAAPFLYYAVTDYQSTPYHYPDGFVADLANLVVPTRLEAAGAWWKSAAFRHFPGNDAERGAYLGLPTLVVIGWFALRRRRTPGGRFLVAALVLVTVAASGSRLTYDQRRLLPGPWGPWGQLESLPLFVNVLPVRLMLYATLAAAVVVALWAASNREPRWARILLPALAVIALVPNPNAGAWAVTAQVPPFFTSGTFRTCLRKGETILPLPISDKGNSMLWQVKAGFWFRMAGGYVSDGAPSSFQHPASVATIANRFPVHADQTRIVKDFVRLKHVSTIVVDKRAAEWRPVLDRIANPQEIGGVLVYRVGSAKGAGRLCKRFAPAASCQPRRPMRRTARSPCSH